MRNTLQETMQRLEFPAEAIACLLKLYDRVEQDPARRTRMQTLLDSFYQEDYSSEQLLHTLTNEAEDMGEPPYTLHLLYFLLLSPVLREKYRETGIADWVFWNSLADLRYKLWECWKVYHVWGSFVSAWFDLFYRLGRFGLGRLQYEPRKLIFQDVTVHGVTLHVGDPVINIHIPSAGPLTKELRLDSYRKAYAFFRKDFGGAYVPIACGSWLLYPEHEKFFPKGSNIVSFMHDFKMTHVSHNEAGLENFGDSWRVFYKPEGTPAEQLPRDTSLQRAFLDWFAKGGDSGSGYGVLIADESGVYND